MWTAVWKAHCVPASLFVGAQVIWLTSDLDSSAASGGVFVAAESVWSLGLITSVGLHLQSSVLRLELFKFLVVFLWWILGLCTVGVR
jgi:hypothetical protein